MNRNDFDVIEKSWELNDNIREIVNEWKINNKEIISRYIMMGQKNINISFDILEDDEWYKYGIRSIDIYVMDIDLFFNYKVTLNVDVQFLLWPFLSHNYNIHVISTNYELQSDEKLIITGIEPESLKLTFAENVDMSSYSSYEYSNISNYYYLLKMKKAGIRKLDDLCLSYFNYCPVNDMEDFLEFVWETDFVKSGGNVYLDIKDNVESTLMRLYKVLDKYGYKIDENGEFKNVKLHLKINKKLSNYRKQVGCKTVEELKQNFNTIKFNDKMC